jgi:hypothetical protein
MTPLPMHDTTSMPVSALAAVPAEVRALPVFNGQVYGGYLILQGVKPFIDGRVDMYPKSLVDAYLQVRRGDPPAAKALFEKYQVAWTILPPGLPLVATLDANPAWRRVYADSGAVVHVRSDLMLRGGE